MASIKSSANALDERDTLYSYVGRSYAPRDGLSKVTGRIRYTGDVRLPGLLHARLVVSPYAHARVLQIDRSVAERLPGVVRVLLAADLGFVHVGSAIRRRDPLARDRVLFSGHPVAVVVATNEAVAEDAAALVSVSYDPLPPVVEAHAALNPAAPAVRARLAADEEAALHGAAAASDEPPPSPNVSTSLRLRRGEVSAALGSADLVVAHSCRIPRVHQGYLEPQVAIAYWDSAEHVTVWSSTQALFFTQAEVAATLGLALHQVTIVPMPVGGAFGGKFALIEPLVAAVARAVGHPVRLVYTRTEEFIAANPAPAAEIRLRLGATSQGQLTALHAELLFDTGCSPSSAARIAPTLLGGHYRIPHLEITSLEVLTHKVGAGSYRAPGAVQAHFALETALDALAVQLGVDPLDLRIQNAAGEGDLRPTGSPWPRIGLLECLRRAQAHPLWRHRHQFGGGARDERGYFLGVGVAAGGWPGGVEPATALCRLNEDGTLTVTVGAVDITGTHTAFAVIAAEAFGLDPGAVHVVLGDSNTAPYSGGSGGSKITYTVGAAVQRAALDARRQVLEIAAHHLEVATDDLELAEGRVFVVGAPDRGLSVRDVARLALAPGSRYRPVLGQGAVATDQLAPGFGVHVARVAVDPVTGLVQVVDYLVVQDVGRAINLAAVQAQIHGGVAQGIGWALYEEIAYDEQGHVVTASLLDYALPKARQVPNIEVVLIEVPAAEGPFGAKGVGEPPVIPVPAAIANAVYDAVGVRLTELPMTPERVYRALTAQRRYEPSLADRLV